MLQDFNRYTFGFFMASCIAALILGSCIAFWMTSGDMPPSMLRAVTVVRLLLAPGRTAPELNGRATDLAEAWVKRVDSISSDREGLISRR